MSFQLPDCGIVFWPVANGDSTTISVDSETHLQVDLNHLQKSEDEDEPAIPVIDCLKESLPKRNGTPYLAAFALTHPDEDHCRGFARLLDEVTIDEIWFTPRIFSEFNKDLCDDALAFKSEANRRVKETIDAGDDAGEGNRVRVIGYSEVLEEPDFEGFPEERLSVPGNDVTQIADKELSDCFRAFVHAPFKDDDAGDRNDTSLGMQISLYRDDQVLQAMLLGDLSYPVIKRIFDVSEQSDLAWNVFLAPHHCSKGTMYWKCEADDEEELKQHIMDEIECASKESNWVVSSSNPVPSSNSPGDNPPHAKAKTQFELVCDSFLCTMENEEPIVATISEGCVVISGTASASSSATEAANKARGSRTTPSGPVTYGKE